MRERWQQTLEELQSPNAIHAGTVRIAAPGDTAYQILAPAILNLSRIQPRLQVVLHCGDTLQHLHRDAIDMAVRYGKLKDSNLMARKISEQPSVLVAAPSYLQQHGSPKTPAELVEHRTITLQLASTPQDSWTLRAFKNKEQIRLDNPLCADGHQARQWALQGHGIAMKSLFDVIDDLESGKLAQVLPKFTGPTMAIHLLFPSKRDVPARVRAVEQLLRHVFESRDHRCTAWLAQPQENSGSS